MKNLKLGLLIAIFLPVFSYAKDQNNWVRMQNAKLIKCLGLTNNFHVAYNSEQPFFSFITEMKDVTSQNKEVEALLSACKISKFAGEEESKSVFLNIDTGQMLLEDGYFKHSK